MTIEVEKEFKGGQLVFIRVRSPVAYAGIKLGRTQTEHSHKIIATATVSFARVLEKNSKIAVVEFLNALGHSIKEYEAEWGIPVQTPIEGVCTSLEYQTTLSDVEMSPDTNGFIRMITLRSCLLHVKMLPKVGEDNQLLNDWMATIKVLRELDRNAIDYVVSILNRVWDVLENPEAEWERLLA